MDFIIEMLIEVVGDVIICGGGELLEDAPKAAGDRKIKLWVRILVFAAITLFELGLAIGLALAGAGLLKGGNGLAAVIFFFIALCFFSCWVNALFKFVKGLRA